jgi:type VI secretion system protein ImpA
MKTAINIDDLLRPIPGDNPAGRDLRYTGVYDRIKEARRSDDLLAQGEWQTEIKTADWKAAIELCSQALAHQSKDLQIAIWLTEALLNHDGYAGLATGLELTLKLLEKYWDTLYPGINGGDLEYRVGPLGFLNEKLPEAVHQVPICDPKITRGYPYYAWAESRLVGFNQNLDKEQKKRRQMLIDEGKVSGEEFSAAVAASPIVFYKDLLAQLEQCRLNLNILDDMVNDRFNHDPPGLSKLADAVDACFHLVDKIFKEKQKSEVMPDRETEERLLPISELNMIEPGEGTHAAIIASGAPAGNHAICDDSLDEKEMWRWAVVKVKQGELKSALDQILAAATLAPSVRKKNRFLLLLSKLCLAAERPDLARPIVENLYALIDTLHLEQWEHPAWIAEVIETLYRCLRADDEGGSERTKQLFEKLCTLNITKAAAYRIG